MSPAEQLRAAKALIDTPEKWTKGAFARNANGDPCRLGEGVCYCTIGALDSFEQGFDDAEEILRDAVPKGFGGDPVAFNDHPKTTHADVMALFDRAIAVAEQGK